jgi:hypothetical protein
VLNKQMTYREASLKGYDYFRANRTAVEPLARLREQVPPHFHQAALGGWTAAVVEQKHTAR